ncbi:MAG: hypothetical protein HY000_23035 [Planctomycetes bacterium]|nr:hypothetical protein [Planctomycetota bacterium]
MPRRSLDLHKMVRDVLQHTSPLPADAECPIRHFEQTANVGPLLIKYVTDHVDVGKIYAAVYDRHMGHLCRMVLAELIEAFERFLKEMAAACVDFLAPYAADDRFDPFLPKSSRHIAAFVNAGSIGKVLCESETWLSNSTINARYCSLLQDHFGDQWEMLFPGPTSRPAAERDRAATLAVLWQMRHSLAHNVGVLTHSDSMRFRVLVGGHVSADRRLSPSRQDLRYVKRFLSETALHTNRRVVTRLADLLTKFHSADPTLFDAQKKADEVSRRFDLSATIAGRVGVL